MVVNCLLSDVMGNGRFKTWQNLANHHEFGGVVVAAQTGRPLLFQVSNSISERERQYT
jgi:hypothetical protein